MATGHVTHVRKLYKLILRLHRSLPDDLRFLGDSYAKEEFRRHKKCKPEEAQIFLTEWKNYAVSMRRQVSPPKTKGENSDDNQSRATAAAADPASAPDGMPPQAPAGGPGIIRPMPRYGNQLPDEILIRFSSDQMLDFYELEEAAGVRIDRGEAVQGNLGMFVPARAQQVPRPDVRGAPNVRVGPNVQVGPDMQLVPNVQVDPNVQGDDNVQRDVQDNADVGHGMGDGKTKNDK